MLTTIVGIALISCISGLPSQEPTLDVGINAGSTAIGLYTNAPITYNGKHRLELVIPGWDGGVIRYQREIKKTSYPWADRRFYLTHSLISIRNGKKLRYDVVFGDEWTNRVYGWDFVMGGEVGLRFSPVWPSVNLRIGIKL